MVKKESIKNRNAKIKEKDKMILFKLSLFIGDIFSFSLLILFLTEIFKTTNTDEKNNMLRKTNLYVAPVSNDIKFCSVIYIPCSI